MSALNPNTLEVDVRILSDFLLSCSGEVGDFGDEAALALPKE